MGATSSAGDKVLGSIIPALRKGQPVEFQCRESREYAAWLVRFGVQGVSLREELTVSPGSHLIDSALETGSLDILVSAARKLADAGADLLAWPCTCASFVGGLAWSRDQMAALTRATGLPATSTSLSMLAAVEEFGAGVVDVLSAYPPRLTFTFLSFLNDAGIDVAAMTSMDCLEPEDSNVLDLRREVNRFNDSLSPRTHPLLIPDTAIDAIALTATLEKDIGRPVIAGNPATLWRCLGLLGVDLRYAEGGLLLSGEIGSEGRLATAS